MCCKIKGEVVLYDSSYGVSAFKMFLFFFPLFKLTTEIFIHSQFILFTDLSLIFLTYTIIEDKRHSATTNIFGRHADTQQELLKQFEVLSCVEIRSRCSDQVMFFREEVIITKMGSKPTIVIMSVGGIKLKLNGCFVSHRFVLRSEL